jgi:hypothetical protein
MDATRRIVRLIGGPFDGEEMEVMVDCHNLHLTERRPAGGPDGGDRSYLKSPGSRLHHYERTDEGSMRYVGVDRIDQR